MSELLASLRKGGQGRLEALVQLGESRLIARGKQVETHAGYVLEPLVGLHTSQPKGRPAFEREQISGMAKELGDDLIGCGLWRRAGVPRRWALGGWRRGLFSRTGQQAGHRQDACVAGRRAGFLPDQVADLLAHGFAQRTLEGGIGLGQGLSQVAQIMGLTKLIATVGQDRGHSRDQALLLVAEHGQDGHSGV